MFPGIYNTSIEIEMNYHEPPCENSEEHGQKHGMVVVLPGWRDRLALLVGQQLITIGQRMTASSCKNMQLSKDLR